MTSVPMPCSSGFSMVKTVMQILYQTGRVPALEDVSQWNIIKAGYARQLILNRFSAEQMEQPAFRDMLLECLQRPEVRQASFWLRLEDDIIQDLSALMKHQTPVQEPNKEEPQSEEPPAQSEGILSQIPKFLVSKVSVTVRKWSSMRP